MSKAGAWICAGVLLALSLAGCQPVSGAQGLKAEAARPATRAPNPPTNTGKKPGGAFIVRPADGFDPKLISTWLFDVDWLLAQWDERNVRFDGEGMTLHARRDPGVRPGYTSGEIQRVGFFGYGRYEVVMRTSNATGVVSTFFVHTDDYVGDPHSEIDFEFLGKTPGKVHLNYMWRDGQGPLDVDLGFDASEAEHLYAFEWRPDSIAWYVDGRLLREVRHATAESPVPTASARVIMSLWVASRSSVDWVGRPDFMATSAFYRCFSHVPMGKTGEQCSDTFKPGARKR